MKKQIRLLTHIFTICMATWTGYELSAEEGNSMTTTASYDVCNINLIYDKVSGYEYSMPKNMLEGFLSGKAFDNPDVYSDAEAVKLRDDINELFQKILSAEPIKSTLAVITAGAPGAGKTVKLHQDLEANKSVGRNYAYICPDDVCLKNQTRTYVADIGNGNGTKEANLAAYNKWRPGSNAATHLILGNLIREKYAFYFGSTSSGPATNKFFDFLKKQGYQIRLIHITASDDVRWESINERDQTFIQTTEKDVKEKGYLLPQRINDTFLAYADEIEFYYRGGAKEDAQLAAKWTRNTEGSEFLGTLQLKDSSKYEQIKTIHNEAIVILKRPDLAWEESVEKNSKLVR